jgi:hypothetical protein
VSVRLERIGRQGWTQRDGKPERSENCFVKLPQTKKSLKGASFEALFEIPAMTYSPTKFPWQYHRR